MKIKYLMKIKNIKIKYNISLNKIYIKEENGTILFDVLL